MIVGVGVDSVEIARIESWQQKPNAESFFAATELEYAAKHSGAAHLAACFALREAVVKALGCGLSAVGRQDIVLAHAESGKPEVVLSGRARELSEAAGITRWHISVTHDKERAIVFAVAESE